MSGAEQVAQEAPASAVPHAEQKRPLAVAPQEGQEEAGEGEGMVTGRR